ncbi:MAG TPA: hypothetical protein VD905_12510 [Flavobacteriales bacterium]|nr:hypothetical protein [Flavobacteriales bacterium]
MKAIFIYILLAFTLFSCGSTLTTRAQRNQYAECRKVLVRHQVSIKHILKDNDTASQFMNDILELDLKGIVKKYNIKKDEVDATVEVICMTSEIFKVLDGTETTMREHMEEQDRKAGGKLHK